MNISPPPPRSPPGEGLGRILDGFESSILGRFWTDFGAPGELKWKPKCRNFVVFSGPLPRSPLGEGLGRILDGFGDDFRRVLNGFGRPGAAQMDMKIDTCRRKFRSCPQDPPREALGTVLGGFGGFGGGFGKVLEGL